MDITDAREERLGLGVDRFLAGDTITYHGVAFYTNAHTLHVDSFSDWGPGQTSEAHARAQLARSKDVLNDLSERSATFSAAAAQLQHEFTVCHSYGTGSVALAKDTDGAFQWLYRSEA